MLVRRFAFLALWIAAFLVLTHCPSQRASALDIAPLGCVPCKDNPCPTLDVLHGDVIEDVGTQFVDCCKDFDNIWPPHCVKYTRHDKVYRTRTSYFPVAEWDDGEEGEPCHYYDSPDTNKHLVQCDTPNFPSGPSAFSASSPICTAPKTEE